MDVNKIAAGSNAPKDINVIIEVPREEKPVKYELDKDSGALFVDRFLHTSMVYPCNYGFIPNTLSDDGDPVDVLVVSELPVMPMSVIRCRPIGVLIMEDEAGQDEKLLAVPVSKLNPFYDDINEYSDLPQILLDKISHFFERYKDLEKNKWVKVTGWDGSKKAEELILQAIENYKG